MLAEGGDHDDVTHGTSIKFGDIEYSTVKGTEPDSKRLDIITSSANAYKTEQSSTSSVEDEDTISSIGSLGSFLGTVPNANALLNYYLELGGDATHYRDLDVQSLITNSTVANSSWLESINNILRASEYLAVEGKTVNIDQTTETQVQLSKSTGLWNKNRDWYLAFIDGFYYTDTDVDNLTVTVAEDGTRTYSATIVYTVIDYYSFYDYRNSEDTSSFLLWGPTRKELAQLHLDGNALDFLIESQLTYTVEWTDGERVGQDELYDRTTESVNESILTVVE